jgi:hypothetical protein
MRKVFDSLGFNLFRSSSMKVAQKRARIRGLENIRWINDRIENIPQLELGKESL